MSLRPTRRLLIIPALHFLLCLFAAIRYVCSIWNAVVVFNLLRGSLDLPR